MSYNLWDTFYTLGTLVQTNALQVRNWIYLTVFYQPLEKFFFQGPTFLGMWAGKPAHDICATITNTDSKIWLKNADDCQVEMQKHFTSFVVSIETILVVISYLIALKTVFFLIKLYLYVLVKNKVHRQQLELLQMQRTVFRQNSSLILSSSDQHQQMQLQRQHSDHLQQPSPSPLTPITPVLRL